ncbi:MarR family winged helix-turn-helix transcriptional regulator [Actinokineospora pegani]|uniref:MarR family winged helix-turn-helix transcriptional regulator n=1 Tax=Actinokineospora pegani TaxID=2654637 RepID=UPI0012EABD55|nr:MarR family winged helix-turn-helix transcriptional regulator [Actinokineospora pegani]
MTAPPGDLSATFLLMTLGKRLRARVDEALRERRMSLRHLSALAHLTRDPGVSYSELARRAGVTAQSMQATLRHLEDLGAVERLSEPGRGRTARLRVTAAGVELSTWARGVVSAVDAEVLAQVAEADRPVLVRALRSVFLS